MKILVKDKIYIKDIEPRDRLAIQRALTLPNPVYQTMLRKKNIKALYALKKDFKYYSKQDDMLVVGRGCLERIVLYTIGQGIELDLTTILCDNTLSEQLNSTIELRDYQEGVTKQILVRNNGIIKLGTGFGKCWKKGTKILMYNGSLKKVEDILIGDKLMGEDSTPRNVLSLGGGREVMYKIIPIKGEPFICNESHILSLKSTPKTKGQKRKIVNISIRDYVNKGKTFKHVHKLWRVGVEFRERDLSLDPYFLGLWLGDGTSRTGQISNPDKEVEDYLRGYAKELGLYFKKTIPSSKCPILSITTKHHRKLKSIPEYLREYNLIQNKHIPEDYKVNSRENRLKMLAGLIDSDGYRNRTTFEIITKYKILRDDILFLSRSLGFNASSSIKIGKIKSLNFEGRYHRITINGDLREVPIRIKRKQAVERKQIKNVLVTGFSIKKLDIDDYYGFEIDGNRLHLLSDFTVVHNTIITLDMIAKTGLKTLIIVPRTSIMSQFLAEIDKYFDVKPGIIQGKTWDIQDITVASFATLQKRDLSEIKEYFGMVFVDECHLAITDKKLETLQQFNPVRLYGLTATPDRTDEQGPAIFFTFGDIIIDKALPQKKPTVTLVNSNVELMGSEYFEMIDEQINNKIRNDLIISHVIREIKDGGKVLVLTKRVAHYQILNSLLSNNYKSYEISSSGTKKNKEELLFSLRDGTREYQVLFGTFSLLAVGVDIPSLSVLVIAGDLKSSVLNLQSQGRVLRLLKGKQDPRIIDIVDNKNGILYRQGLARKRLYKSMDLTVNYIK